MAEAPDYSDWLTKQQAAAAIGCSTKTVEKLAADNQIQQGYRKRPETGARVSVYHRGDVDRIREERQPGAEPFVLPEASERQTTALTVQRSNPDPPATASILVNALVALAGHSQNSENVRVAERVFLKLSEASEYAGLPKTYIRSLMQSGKIEALRTGGGWRIRRAALESL